MEMKLSDNDEIVVRGPNVFPGYWNRPQQTAEVLRDGWFHTGDQGELDGGTWRIVGRIKNLIVLGSGHKLAPESMEDEILRLLPNAQQVVIVGNGRGYLSAIITGDASRDQVQAALDRVNRAASPLQANSCFLCPQRAVLDREWHAHGQRQAETRPDFEVHEQRDRRHVPGGEDRMNTAQVTKRGQTMSYSVMKEFSSSRLTAPRATKSGLCLWRTLSHSLRLCKSLSPSFMP